VCRYVLSMQILMRFVLLWCTLEHQQGKAKGSKVKFVDARMRNDTKSMKRAVKRKAGKSPSSGKRRYK
jgi:hypothetical protein